MTNEVTRNIITRRSCKKFKSDPVPREMIDAVVEAGLYAANGMGKQSPIINEKSPMRNSLWLLQHYWHCHSKNR
jgi:nitroreductase